MMHLRERIVRVALYSISLLFSACLLAAETPGKDAVKILSTKAGVRYGIWPDVPKSPAPLLFVLGGTIEDTLGVPYFRQCGNQLAAQGCVCVSVDMPCHGNEQRAGEPAGIEGWRYRCEQGENIATDVAMRLSAVLDHLLETGAVDPERIAACGTSRGGFMAMHFAALEPRVKCVAAFAPVADLTVLREFQGIKERKVVDSLTLTNHADRLAGRGVWLIIGDRDDRVGTDQTIELARRITAAALEKKVPALVDLHVVAEPQGHTTPAGAAEQAAVWFQQQFNSKK